MSNERPLNLVQLVVECLDTGTSIKRLVIIDYF